MDVFWDVCTYRQRGIVNQVGPDIDVIVSRCVEAYADESRRRTGCSRVRANTVTTTPTRRSATVRHRGSRDDSS